ncbi:MAG: hypothetical protein AAF799_30345 [Myxococcota bacterium]
MKNTISRTLALALTAFALGCPKPATETPEPVTPDTPSPEQEALTVCLDEYTVVGAVENGQIETTIGQQNINDTPFECMLVGREQQVAFAFKPTSTDPKTGCEYRMSYVDKSGGQPFSEQTLNCEAPRVAFDVRAEHDPAKPECEVEALDPQIQLRTNNCGSDGE